MHTYIYEKISFSYINNKSVLSEIITKLISIKLHRKRDKQFRLLQNMHFLKVYNHKNILP